MPKLKRMEFRDVSAGLAKLRDFLIGRKHVPHNRFPPLLASRTLPTPDIPRGPEYKYSDQYYCYRSALGSVHPPVVAPIALGAPQSKICGRPPEPKPPVPPDCTCTCDDEEKKDPKPKPTVTERVEPIHIQFPTIPSPGLTYWWDAHCYYECVPDYTPPPPKPKPSPAPPPPPRPRPDLQSETLSNDPCDPCQPPRRCD